MGVGLGYSLIAYRSTLRGLDKLEVDRNQLAADLAASWEVLAEAIQTVMRRHGIPEPYEKLKALTRGQAMDAERIRPFVDQPEQPGGARRTRGTPNPERT